MPIRLGLIGEDISYSKSPQLFNAMFESSGMDGSFSLFPTEPEELASRFEHIRSQGIDGLAVTIPFKQRIMGLLTRIETPANRIGAVNGVSIRGGTAVGYNTDAAGFVAPLEAYREQFRGKGGLVIGAGGAAAAVAYSLTHDLGLSVITVAGRSPERLAAFERHWKAEANGIVRTVALSQLGELDCSDSAIVVNCTPLGGATRPDQLPVPDQFVWPSGAIYYDLNYNENNLALQVAREVGVRAIDGSAMLAAQATGLFEIWTGKRVDWQEIHAAVFGRGPSRRGQ